MLISVVILIHFQRRKKEPHQLRNFRHQIGLWTCLGPILLYVVKRIQPIVVGATPGRLGLGCIHMAAEQARGSMPVSNIPLPWLFPWIPALASLDDRLESARDLISLRRIPRQSLRDCIIIYRRKGILTTLAKDIECKLSIQHIDQNKWFNKYELNKMWNNLYTMVLGEWVTGVFCLSLPKVS